MHLCHHCTSFSCDSWIIWLNSSVDLVVLYIICILTIIQVICAKHFIHYHNKNNQHTHPYLHSCCRSWRILIPSHCHELSISLSCFCIYMVFHIHPFITCFFVCLWGGGAHYYETISLFDLIFKFWYRSLSYSFSSEYKVLN